MQHLEEKISCVEEKVDTVGRNVNEIKMLLQGNPFDRTDNGMIGEVADLRKRLTRLERLKDRFIYIGLGLSAGCGYAISDVVVKIFGHK